MILANKRGIAGRRTQPVAMSAAFLRALYNIEREFDDKTIKYSINEGGRKRHLNHVTEADLYVATVLFALCNTNGQIHRVSRHAIYQRLEELYENPISSPQFYEALEKFKLHRLIKEEQHQYGVVSYKLNYFLQDQDEDELPWLKTERPKAARYFLLHPVVFSVAFTSLSLSSKKLFYSVAAQQGIEKDKPVERLFTNRNKDVQFMGLYKLLHKAHPYQVRKVLDELSSPTLFTQTPLFSRAEIQKTSGQYKATMSIHPDFILAARKGEEYRETIHPRKVYRRTAAFIEKVLASMSLKEMVTENEINDLVRFFKGKGYRVIRPALEILKQFYQKHRNLPNNLIGYLTKTIRSMTEFTFRNLLERTQLLDFVAPHGNDDEEQRWSQFLNAISHYKPRIVEQACKVAAPLLFKQFRRTATYDATEYQGNAAAKIKGIELVRRKAFHLQKQVDAYCRMERTVLAQQGKLTDNQVIEYLLSQVELLPDAEKVIIVPPTFTLETYLRTHILPQS